MLTRTHCTHGASAIPSAIPSRRGTRSLHRLRRAVIVDPEVAVSEGGVPAPTVEQPPWAAVEDYKATGCPFLQGLSRPPASGVPWYRQLRIFQDIFTFQKDVMQNRRIVANHGVLGKVVAVADADLVKKALMQPQDGDLGINGWPEQLGDLMGQDCLAIALGQRHKVLKELMNGAFNAEAIAAATPLLVEITNKYLNQWADAGTTVMGEEAMMSFTFDFIFQVTMCSEMSDETMAALNTDFQIWRKGFLSAAPLDLPFLPYGKALRARERFDDFIMGAIAEAEADAERGRPNQGVIGRLLAGVDENGKRFSKEVIADNVFLILWAGHDSSAASLCLTLHYMTRHPQVLHQLRAEQQALIDKHGSEITPKVVREMPFAEACVRESIRLNNIIAAVFRMAARDTELGGYLVKKGENVMVPMTYMMLNDPRWVNESDDMAPEAYNPYRWIAPDGKGLLPWYMSPFSMGPRSCMGPYLAMAEMKIFLAMIARGYNVEVDPSTKFGSFPVPLPKTGMPMSITRIGI